MARARRCTVSPAGLGVVAALVASAGLARAGAALPSRASAAHGLPPPRVILTVIADDLGWFNVGFHHATPSPEIVTPNLDSLVAQGINLTAHFVYNTCTPSRCSFLTGRLGTHVQTTLDNPEVPSSGVPYNMTVVAAKLQAAGYYSAVAGKWDAGMATVRHTPAGT
jgi:arylsulfatase I/J